MIAGGSAVALFLIMFIFKWFGLEDAPAGVGGPDAWEAFSFIDIILLLTIGAAIAVAVMSAAASSVNLPVAGSALVAGLGILSAVLILFRIIFPPDIEGFGFEIGTNPAIGVFLGLIAAAGIAYGGWVAMQEEGTSFGDQRDRVSGGSRGPDGPRDEGGPPPPPPPQA